MNERPPAEAASDPGETVDYLRELAAMRRRLDGLGDAAIRRLQSCGMAGESSGRS